MIKYCTIPHLKVHVVFVVSILFSLGLHSQTIEDTAKQTVDIKTIKIPVLERYMTFKINQERITAGLSELVFNQIMKKTSADQASYMSDIGTIEQSNPGDRSVMYGGTRSVTEILGKCSIYSTKKISYVQIYQSFIDKWKTNSKIMSVMLDKEMTFIGVSVAIDQIGEKLFTSIVFGNENSIAPVLDKSAGKYISVKSFGLQNFNAKICSKCNKFSGLDKLSDNVVLEDNNIFFVYDNLKKIKQLIKGPEDGLAIDIVSKSQFKCGKENILNYRVPNKGIILKPLFTEEFYKLNTEAPKSNRVKVKLGVLPKELIADSVELNLVVISQNTVCKNSYKTQLIIPEMKYDYINSLTYKNDKISATTIYTKANKKTIDSLFVSNTTPKVFEPDVVYNTLLTCNNNTIDFADADFDIVTSNIDKLKQTESYKNDTSVREIEVLILKKIISSITVSPLIQEQALIRLKALEPINNLRLQLHMYQFFCNKSEFETAINWIDFSEIFEFFPHEVLFSALTVSTLFPERLNSKNFLQLMEKASKADNVLFCSLFKKNSLSVQILENQNIKRVFCESCKNE